MKALTGSHGVQIVLNVGIYFIICQPQLCRLVAWTFYFCFVTVEKVWETFITKNPPEQGYFVRVKVGPREIWKDKNCPFRTDKTLRLTSIPTLIKWGSPQRLSDDQILNPECLAMLMEDDD